MNESDMKRPPGRDQAFGLRVERWDRGAVVYATGSCTMEVAHRLGETIREVADEKRPLILLDLSNLEFIESTGLGGIVSGYLRVRRYKGEVRIVAPCPSIRHVLEVTRLTHLFPVFETLEMARKSPMVQ